jgi:hypothetical protein
MPAQYNKKGNDVEAYLAGIRKTIADSNAVVAQAELRIQETDRMLAQQGLTREQVLAMQFSDEQVRAANEELKRRGMAPLDDDAVAMLTQPPSNADTPPLPQSSTPPLSGSPMPLSSSDAELENRQRKFGMMMKPFQI